MNNLKNRKKTGFILFLYILLISPLWSQNAVSKQAENLFEAFMDLRRTLSYTETDTQALEEIEVFMKEKYQPLKDSFSEEENMIMENFYLTERYNYLQYDKNGGAEISEKELLSQLEKNTAFFSKNKGKDFSPWNLVTSANVIGCYMSFHPIPAALKYGQTQKEYYRNAWEQTGDFWYASSHYAQWFFFAPGFYGGGKKKAEALFLKSLELAKTDTEKYYSNIFLSQFYFTEGNKNLSKEYLDKADTYLPGGRYVEFIRKINSQGKSTFEYKEE